MLNVGRATVNSAKTVLKDGTADEIAAIEAGAAAVSTTALRIRSRRPKEKKKTGKLADVGKNPARIENLRLRAELWRHVRDALNHLTSLPRPDDVVAIVRAMDKSGHVDRRLSRSLKWLKEFEHVWKHPDKD